MTALAVHLEGTRGARTLCGHPGARRITAIPQDVTCADCHYIAQARRISARRMADDHRAGELLDLIRAYLAACDALVDDPGGPGWLANTITRDNALHALYVAVGWQYPTTCRLPKGWVDVDTQGRT
jgi:hypothetical protein